jgi:dipeptidyl aminopeptidase/acylaminoacyl peptidase
MNYPTLCSCVVSLVLVLAADAVCAQGTRLDYQRADNLGQLTRNRVFRDRVRPHWFPDNRAFWYRVDTGPESHEFVLVDVQAGTRQPAFDHQRLAAALTAAGVPGVSPQQLPIGQLQWDQPGHALIFRGPAKWWRLDLDQYTLSEHAAQPVANGARPLAELPRASRRTGAETEITFVNRSRGDVELLWLDAAGQRRSYGTLRAGQQRVQHTYEGHVWLIVDSGGGQLVWFQGESEPTVAEIDGSGDAQSPPPKRPRSPGRSSNGASPDGRWQAFVQDHNVHLRELATGRELSLSDDGTTDDGYEGRFFWSPDSLKLVAVRSRQGDERRVYYVESAPRDQLQPKLHSYEYLKPGDQIAIRKPQLFDVAAQRRIPISDQDFANPWSVSDVHWAPDSKRFLFLYNQRGHQVLRVLAVDAATGGVAVIVDEHSETFIDYAGKQYLRYLDDSQEIIWMSERDGWNHLYLVDAETGQVKHEITQGPWVVRSVERVDESQRQIWFRAGGVYPDQDPYFVHYCRANFDGSGFVILTAGDGTHAVEFSPDGRYFLDQWSRVDLPPVTQLRRADDGGLVCELERADWRALLETGWQPPERFTAVGRDGQTEIYGVIYRPTNFAPDIRYPLIEQIYAGPQGAFVPKSFRSYHRPQSLAELGFIVVQIDGMGTSHRSKKFHDVCWKNLGDSGFPDRIAWIRAAAQAYPWIDLTRVGIYGGSAGGQSATRALLAHGDFYHVAVSDCGCHDNRMDKIWWNELWMGWPVGPHYEQQSNVTQAHRLQGKLLLIVGEMDENVDPASTMQVVDALIRADKDFDLLVIPGRGHGAAESDYGTRRRRDFFVRHLLGVEPRAK